MPIMKLHDNYGTHYVPHPHRVVMIYDGKVWDPSMNKFVPGVSMQMGFHHQGISVQNIAALKLKREVQENTEQDIGFLKLNMTRGDVSVGNMYVNLDHVFELRVEEQRAVLVMGISPDGGAEHLIYVDDPLQVALQMRRVLNRLDQDEELCCNAPPDAEAEAEDPAPA